VQRVFKLKPAEIIETLELLRPVYEGTSSYGHFGRTRKKELEDFTWERTDKVDALRDAV
jgi:S-adenosylmethionine synthetase